MTYAEAVARYRAGKWRCPPPPVYSGNWSEADWAFYIFGVAKPREAYHAN